MSGGERHLHLLLGLPLGREAVRQSTPGVSPPLTLLWTPQSLELGSGWGRGRRLPDQPVSGDVLMQGVSGCAKRGVHKSVSHWEIS